MRDDIPVEELTAPDRCAVLVVDVQNDFCHPDGVVGRAGGDLVQVDGMVDAIGRVRAAAAAAQVPVVFVVTEHRPETNSPSWLRRSHHAERICVPGTWGVEPLVAPVEGDLVVWKHRYSGFYGTRLESVVRALGRTTVVVCGVNTDVCVEGTVRDAFMRDLDVVVPWDATATRDEETRQHSALTMSRHYAIVLTADDVVERWTGARRDVAA